jgi:hypothetical protein
MQKENNQRKSIFISEEKEIKVKRVEQRRDVLIRYFALSPSREVVAEDYSPEAAYHKAIRQGIENPWVIASE